MKKSLTSEQSQHLIDLGVPSKKASLVAVKQLHDWQGNAIKNPKEIIRKNPFKPAVMGFETFQQQPVFRLEDFLNGEILPKEIMLDKEHGLDFGWDFYANKWYARYSDEDSLCMYGDAWHLKDELIDALYKLTCWYYEEKNLS